jgi:hypothetical protein
MSRSDPQAPRPDPTQLTEEELHQLAAHVVDYLLSPSLAFWRRGFSRTQRNPGLLKEALGSLGLPLRAQDTGWLTEFGHALGRKNKKKLLVLIKEAFRKDPPSFEQVLQLRHLNLRALGRKALLEVAERLKGERGIPARIEPTEYPELAALGDRLTPACEKILQDVEATPNRSLTGIVEGCRTEYPEATTFLLRHFERLESALKDTELLNRAKKIDTRAGLLADAMAGAEYGVTPRTSIERARTGRRVKGSNSP